MKNKDLVSKLKDLTDEQLVELLHSISDEYDEMPVSIEEFVSNEEYLGRSFSNGFNKYWLEVLKEIYPTPYNSPYWLVNLRGSIGRGKGLSSDTSILTPLGYKPIKDISVGDIIYGQNGRKTKVIGVYPQGLKDVYKITFSNGTEIICDDTHLWKYQTQYMRSQKKWSIATTKDLVEIPLTRKFGENNASNIFIPTTDPVEFDPQELIIPAYVMGVLLGDGSLTNNVHITNSEKDIIDKVKDLLPESLNINTKKSVSNEHQISSVTQNKRLNVYLDYLKKVGLYNKKSSQKWIPREYLFNSIENRLALLQGLIDTDGYWKGSKYEYSTSSEQLSKDIMFLCDTLGLDVVISTKIPTYTYKGEKKQGLTAYRLYIKPSEKFQKLHTSKKHDNKWKKPQSWSKTIVKNIEKLPNKQETICIKVDNEDELFLTDRCIVTHNTTTSNVMMLYETYLLLCLTNPQATKKLGMVNTTIVFALMSPLKTTGLSVVWNQLTTLMLESPYFLRQLNKKNNKKSKLAISYNETILPKRIDYFVGSKINHTLGKAIYCASISEANFEIYKNQIEDMFNSVKSRIQSRYEQGQGKIIIDSSESAKDGVVNKIVNRYRNDPGVYIDSGAIWKVWTHKYTKGTFKVHIGSEINPPCIIDMTNQYHLRLMDEEPNHIIDVPEEHYTDFDSDIERAIQDLAGVGTISSYKLFKHGSKLRSAFVIDNIFNSDVIQLDFDDNEIQISSFLNDPDYFSNPIYPTSQRCIHIDIGLTGDYLGIASSLITGFKEVKLRDSVKLTETISSEPEITTEWALGIKPTPGREIPLHKIRLFFSWLQERRYPIFKISADGFQSADMLQQIKLMGYESVVLSVDKTAIPYLNLRNSTYRETSYYPINNHLMKEMENLEIIEKGMKVDHPALFDDNTKGSKDVADAVCGSQHMARISVNDLAYSFHLGNSSLDGISSKNKKLANMFWGM